MLAKLPPTVHVGSYSTGTLRPQDLGPVMFAVLRSLDSKSADTFEMGWSAIIEAGFDDDKLHRMGGFLNPSEQIAEAMVCLDEALDDLIPRGFRWGSHEGDGADIGIWPVDTGDDQDDTTEGQDEAPARPVVRRRYVAEQIYMSTWGVHEYKGESLVRRVGPAGGAGLAKEWAAAMNDAIARFMSDNNIEIPDA